MNNRHLTEVELEKIDRYLQSEMEEGERKEFEKRLKEDSILQQEVNLQNQLMLVFKQREDTQLRNILAAEEEQIVTTTEQETAAKIVPFTQKKWWKYAAAISLFALFLWGITNFLTPSEDIFTIYFKPYPATIFAERDNSFKNNEALQAYQAGNYQDAKRLFQALPDSLKIPKTLFYQATVYLILQEFSLAIPIFQQLQKSTNHGLEEPVEWYLALSYLKVEERDKAVFLLKKIAQKEGGYYQKEAQLIIKRLK